jgi:hypothetical protein
MLEGSCHCGSVRWTFDGTPESATACNCTICRRYGVLWAYGHENEDIRATGETQTYDRGGGVQTFNFCPKCGCVAYWRALKLNEEGKRRIAVNLRLADDPKLIASLPILHFDGLDTWTDLPQDGRCIKDMWF